MNKETRLKLPATLPLWCLKKQRKFELARSKFQLGDIVFVDNSKYQDEDSRLHFDNGLGVICEVFENDYGIDFGPKGKSWWYPEKTLTLISSHIFVV